MNKLHRIYNLCKSVRHNSQSYICICIYKERGGAEKEKDIEKERKKLR